MQIDYRNDSIRFRQELRNQSENDSPEIRK